MTQSVSLDEVADIGLEAEGVYDFNFFLQSGIQRNQTALSRLHWLSLRPNLKTKILSIPTLIIVHLFPTMIK